MEQSKIRIVSQINFFQSRKWLDEQAYERAFLEHYTRVFDLLLRLVGDRYEADDLTAETFWRLWTHPPADNRNLGGWLYRVATRLGYNALRSAKRRTDYETHAGMLDIPLTAQIDPVNEAEDHMERLRVRQILKQMPLRDVQILLLRHSGLAYQEIASAAQVSPASVGKLLARAEEKFERLYQKGDRHAPQR